MAQLPSDAASCAAGILIYSFICLFASLLLFLLVCVHREQKSYVGLLAFSTSLSTVASIVQLIHTIVDWADVTTAQYYHEKANPANPELIIAGKSTGLDLAFFYIRWYSYNVQAITVLLWASELAISVFKATQHNSNISQRVRTTAKLTAVFLPVIQVCLLQSSKLKNSKISFLVLANIIVAFSLVIGSVLMLVLLIKYILARSTLLSWDVHCGQATAGDHKSGMSGASRNTTTSSSPKRTIYDVWLVARFAVAFAAISVFELFIILFDASSSRESSSSSMSTTSGPDLSAAQACSDLSSFAIGVTVSLVAFLVFGTTSSFRKYVCERIVPRGMRARTEEREMRRKMPIAAAAACKEGGVSRGSDSRTMPNYSYPHKKSGDLQPEAAAGVWSQQQQKQHLDCPYAVLPGGEEDVLSPTSPPFNVNGIVGLDDLPRSSTSGSFSVRRESRQGSLASGASSKMGRKQDVIISVGTSRRGSAAEDGSSFAAESNRPNQQQQQQQQLQAPSQVEPATGAGRTATANSI